MSIGGVDVVLLAPATECIGDVIVRACRGFWPNRECVFRDAHEHATHPLSDPWVWTVGVAQNEFSVYRDAAAAASWKEHGAVKSNANTMFHFIIGEPMAGEPSLIEVAMIFDKLTRAVRAFVSELQNGFLSLKAQVSEREAA
jgi:hypothetical protein